VFDHEARGSNMEKQSLELLLAQGESIERIAKRFCKDPSTVSYWMKKHGLESPYREKHAAKGGIERERLEALVGAEMSIAEIAAAVQRSKGTVRHWLRRYELRTRGSAGRATAAARRAAREAGVLATEMVCPRHGAATFILEGRGYYRCKRCRTESVVRHRQRVKSILVQEAGGRCVVCGYDRSIRALRFHHLDPSLKRLGLSGQGVTYSIETLRAEARKCVLLCGNCHVEVEAGVAQLPLELASLTGPEQDSG
jgi:transposase